MQDEMCREDKIFCVYIWHDPRDNCPRYVGKGLPSRPFVHLKPSGDMRIGRMLKKRIKDGYDPQPTIFQNLTEQEAFDLEKRLIAQIGRLDTGSGTLFNKTDGGDGVAGRVVTDEHRQHISNGVKLICGTIEWREAQSQRRKNYFNNEPTARVKTGKASSARWNDPAFAERHRSARQKPCTIDGVNIYPSVSALIAALGAGKNGSRSPNFRHINKD